MNFVVLAILTALIGCGSAAEVEPLGDRPEQVPGTSVTAPVQSERAPDSPAPTVSLPVSTDPVVADAPVTPAPPVALLLPNETAAFSFKTKKGKTMNIAVDKENRYVVYRYGTEQHVELQFPAVLENTAARFIYKYYMRGGGPENEGLDLNELTFTGAANRFTVYDEQYYENGKERRKVGIRVENLRTGKESDIRGRVRTVKGSLIDFRPDGDLAELVTQQAP